MGLTEQLEFRAADRRTYTCTPFKHKAPSVGMLQALLDVALSPWTLLPLLFFVALFLGHALKARIDVVKSNLHLHDSHLPAFSVKFYLCVDVEVPCWKLVDGVSTTHSTILSNK